MPPAGAGAVMLPVPGEGSGQGDSVDSLGSALCEWHPYGAEGHSVISCLSLPECRCQADQRSMIK